MNFAINTFRFALLGLGIAVVNPIVDQANAGSNRERFQICKQLKQSGKLRWHSIASGIVDDGVGRNGYSGFHVKACHSSKRSCQQWVSNVWREIPRVDSVETAYCSPAN